MRAVAIKIAPLTHGWTTTRMNIKFFSSELTSEIEESSCPNDAQAAIAVKMYVRKTFQEAKENWEETRWLQIVGENRKTPSAKRNTRKLNGKVLFQLRRMSRTFYGCF